MISIRASKGTNNVIADLKRHDQFFRTGIRNALHEIGSEVVKETRRLIKVGPKTGVKYPNLPNRSSKAGEAPANQSGRLKDSSDYVVHSEHRMEVGERVFYAEILENVIDRPHLIKAIKNKQRETENSLRDYVVKEIKA